MDGATTRPRSEHGAVWRLGWPLALAQAGLLLTGVVDTVMIARVSVEALEFSDARPRTDAAALDRIPRPRAPALALAIGGAIERPAGIVGLLDEAPRIGGVDDVLRISGPGQPGDGRTLMAIDTDPGGAVVDE